MASRHCDTRQQDALHPGAQVQIRSQKPLKSIADGTFDGEIRDVRPDARDANKRRTQGALL